MKYFEVKKGGILKREFYKLSLVAIMVVFSFSLGFFMGREVTLAHLEGQAQNTSHEQTKEKNQALSLLKPGIKTPNQAPPSHHEHKKPSPSSPELDQSPSKLFAQTQKARVRQYKKEWLNKNQQTQKLVKKTLPHKPPQTKTHASQNQTKSPQIDSSSSSHHLPQSPKSQNDIILSATTKQLEKASHIRYALRVQRHKTKEKAMEQSANLKLKFPKWRFFFKKVNTSYTVYIGPWALRKSAENVEKLAKNKKELASIKLEKIKL